MMIRMVSTAVGIVTGAVAASVEAPMADSQFIAVAWAIGTGLLFAAMTYGVLTNKVNTARARIAAEKSDREKAIADLKADVNRGFDRIDTALERQTNTVLDALARHTGAR